MLRPILFLLLLSSVLTAQSGVPDGAFRGKALIAISDADMLPSAYENGQLGPRQGKDLLTVIPLDGPLRETSLKSTGVTNSVAGPPSVMAASKDGQFIYVIETFTPRPNQSDDETFADFKLGTTLSVLQVTAGTPEVVQEVAVPARPLSVSLDASGQWLVISYHPGGGGATAPLSLHPVREGLVGEAFFPAVPGWDLADELVDVSWHPTRSSLALINNTRGTVSFFDVVEPVQQPVLSPWGNTVFVGKFPFIGRFSRDGNHFLTNCLFWGADVANTWTEAPNGMIVNIALDHHAGPEGKVHALTSQVTVGPSPEGFAVSPDGTHVVAVNMERSWLLRDDARQSWFSSLSLIRRDPTTGTMRVVSTTPYYAVLPEMAVFDASGEYLAVVCADQYDDKLPGGALDFFRLVRDPLAPEREFLVQMRRSVRLQHGAHDLLLVE